MGNKVAVPDKLTEDMFLRALPKKTRIQLQPGMVDEINAVLVDPQLRENFRENLLSYTSVMMDGRFKIVSYINAVRYVSHKLLGSSNVEAYSKTFPGRYQQLLNEGAEPKTITAYATSYNKTKLVNKIVEQTLVPMHVLNADIYQKAINKQAVLMMTANSEKVQSDAANSLLTHLKPPEASKIELDVNVKDSTAITELKNTMRDLALQQRKQIQDGYVNAKDVAHSKLLIEGGEVVDEN